MLKGLESRVEGSKVRRGEGRGVVGEKKEEELKTKEIRKAIKKIEERKGDRRGWNKK